MKSIFLGYRTSGMQFTIIFLLTLLNSLSGELLAEEHQLIEPLLPFVAHTISSLESIPTERKQILDELKQYIISRVHHRDDVNLMFICTHNSRRSHLAQVFCEVAATHYQVPRIRAMSGGTEATACNIRTVRAFRRAGISVVATTTGANPIYLMQYAEASLPIQVFSKVFTTAVDQDSGFAALMCCSDADERCPTVVGADARFALHYVDPKAADDTPEESHRYDERCQQIAAEMFYVMSEVAKDLKNTTK